MLVIRLLLVAIIIVAICLLILPKTQKSEELEKKTFKILGITFITLVVLFALALYQFKDQLWHDNKNLDLLYKKILTTPDGSKFVGLSKYDFSNIQPLLIVRELESLDKLKKINLTNLYSEQISFVSKIINNNNSIQIVNIKRLSNNSVTTLLNHLEPRDNLKLIFKNIDFDDLQLKLLQDKKFNYSLIK